MTIKLGIVMDPISAINIKKDSSFAMLEEAQKRGYELFYLEMKDLYMEGGRAFGTMRRSPSSMTMPTGTCWARWWINRSPAWT